MNEMREKDKTTIVLKTRRILAMRIQGVEGAFCAPKSKG